jgi:cell wall-associated NlpC family hydrolase
MKGRTLALVAGFTAIVLVVIVGTVSMFATVIPTGRKLVQAPCGGEAAEPSQVTVAAPGGMQRVGRWGSEEIANVASIVAVGREMDVPPRGWVIATATAMQESTLKNLNFGDRDSLGLFQQRPSAGWGTPTQITSPQYASRKFYEGLLQVPGWPTMRLTDAAQRVQVSAFPEAYQKWENDAETLVSKVGFNGSGVVPKVLQECPVDLGPSKPAGAVGDFLRIALEQVGDPYVYAAIGPDSFDCSGLIVFSWKQAGYKMPVRTAEQMRQISTPIPAGQEQPGDLIFSVFNSPRVPGGAGHVQIVVKKGLLLEAPHTGLDVRTRPYDSNDPEIRFGRLPQSKLKPVSGTEA